MTHFIDAIAISQQIAQENLSNAHKNIIQLINPKHEVHEEALARLLEGNKEEGRAINKDPRLLRKMYEDLTLPTTLRKKLSSSSSTTLGQ